MRLQYKLFILLLLSIFSSLAVFSQDFSDNEKYRISYDKDNNISTVFFKGIEIPNSEDSFAIGAAFQYTGEKFESELCYIQIFFTSMSKKNFKYKKDHNLIIWADKEKFDFGKIGWQESPGGTAFIIAEMFYPEEMFVAMEREKFLKIINSSKIKVKIGKFSFQLTNEQLMGLKDFAHQLNVIKSTSNE